MSEQAHGMLSCPSRDEWLHALSAREGGQLEQRPDLQQHLDGCAECRAATADVRRFQTLLLRGRPSGLNAEQRSSLDERVRMMAGRWDPPARSPWLVWGVALTAATAIALLLLRPFDDRPPRQSWEERMRAAVAANAAAQIGTGSVIGGVEGDVQVAGRDGQWSRLTAGAFISPGAKLRSVNGGSLTVPGRFETVLERGAEAEVVALHDNVAFLRVRQGSVACQVAKLQAGQQFAVMFGAFRASVVGTRFAVRQLPGGAGGEVQVTEGAVRVDAAEEAWSPQGETTTVVRAGQRWRHAGGIMSLEPIPQLPAAVAPEPAVAEPASPAEPSKAAQAGPAAGGGDGGAAGSAAVEAKGAAGKPSDAKPVDPKGHAADRPKARNVLIQVPQQTMPPPSP